MATGVNSDPLSFDSMCEKIRQVGSSRAEARILAHLVRCRTSGFMVLLPALEEVSATLEQLVDDDGDSQWFQRMWKFL